MEEEADLLSTIDALLIGLTAGGADELALPPRKEEVRPIEGLFAWPLPKDPLKALFMVDDIAELAMWECTS